MVQESSFTFTTPLNVNVVEIKGEEHLYVEGDISTNDLDFVNDIMERNMKLDLEHEAFKGNTHEEREISKTKIPAGKLIDSTIKNLGNNRFSTRVKGEINRHNPNYVSTKGNLLEGYLDAFSVAFLVTDVDYQTIEGKSISVSEYYILQAKERRRIIKDVILLNVALTGNPCNTKAQMVEVYTKALDAMEEYKALKELDPSIEGKLEVKDTSHSSDHKEGEQLNNQKISKKMTDEKPVDVKPIEPNEELKSMSEEMKSMKESNEAVIKDNTEVKESVSKMAETLKEVVEAMNKPVHKSPGVQKSDAEEKTQSENKSVDPLELCY
jgi:hypothetical protein